jgi:hypothetical protein
VGGTVPRSADDLERLLASRALHRLEYSELLTYTPDPFGDWITGRLDRLAFAELETVGLRRVGNRLSERAKES